MECKHCGFTPDLPPSASLLRAESAVVRHIIYECGATNICFLCPQNQDQSYTVDCEDATVAAHRLQMHRLKEHRLFYDRLFLLWTMSAFLKESESKF